MKNAFQKSYEVLKKHPLKEAIIKLLIAFAFYIDSNQDI